MESSVTSDPGLPHLDEYIHLCLAPIKFMYAVGPYDTPRWMADTDHGTFYPGGRKCLICYPVGKQRLN